MVMQGGIPNKKVCSGMPRRTRRTLIHGHSAEFVGQVPVRGSFTDATVYRE